MNNTEYLMSLASTKRRPKEDYPQKVAQLLSDLGYDVHACKYVHITGSKGKGSLAISSYQLLKESGEKVGLFVSPHVFAIEERFVTHNGMINENRLRSLIQQWQEFLKKQELHFFEICLFLALIYFIEEQCDYVVLEVGVGGRFDPTNFCRPIVSLLAHISMEHRDFLGNTLEEVAWDKAGIIKKNIPAFSVDQEKRVQVIFEKEAPVQFLKKDDLKVRITPQDSYPTLDLDFPTLKIDNLELSRIGWGNILNFALVLWALSSVYPLQENVIRKVAHQVIPYRMHRIAPNIILDTAHNGASFRNLLGAVAEFLHWDTVVLFITIIEGKELQDIVDAIQSYQGIIKKIILFECENSAHKKTQAKELADLLPETIVKEYYTELTAKIIEQEQEQNCIFAGSFYSIPKIESLLQGQNKMILL